MGPCKALRVTTGHVLLHGKRRIDLRASEGASLQGVRGLSIAAEQLPNLPALTMSVNAQATCRLMLRFCSHR